MKSPKEIFPISDGISSIVTL